MATYTYCGNYPKNSTLTNSFINVFDEANSVASLGTTTILNYVVPSGKRLKLRTIEASGDNRATFSINKNGNTESKKRTYFTEYNATFNDIDMILYAGETLDIIVENRSSSIADFNANFIGSLEDA